MGVCNCSMFCCTLLYVHSSIAIILMGKRELIALLNLSSWCLVVVERLFLVVPRGCLQSVIVVFPDHTHLLFLYRVYSHFNGFIERRLFKWADAQADLSLRWIHNNILMVLSALIGRLQERENKQCRHYASHLGLHYLFVSFSSLQ